MGEVLKAVDPDIGGYVAIKTLGQFGDDPEVVARFEQEGLAAMVLDHPNIGKIHRIDHDNDGRPVLVLEYIDGVPVDEYVRERRTVPFSTQVDMIIQAARGLEAALRRGIIHRDIKPSNILVNKQEQVKIIDFGLAKSMWEAKTKRSGGVVGTPRYIAPEQAMGKLVDHRSDMYSLGATFYEMVTHKAPFDGETSMSIMLAHVNTPLVPPYVINPAVPNDVSEIICRMMAKDPADRYRTYEPLIRDLESAKIHRLARERRVTASTPGNPLPEVVDNSTPFTEKSEERSPRSEPSPAPPPPSHLLRWMLVILAVAVVAGVVSFVHSLKNRRHAEASPPLMSRVFGSDAEKNAERDKLEKLAQQDEDAVRLTKTRMDKIVAAITTYRQDPAHMGKVPRIVDLRAEKMVSVDESQDGWGNDFIITSAKSGRLIAPGRDGVEGTEDDFVYTLDGRALQVPQPKSPTEFSPTTATPTPEPAEHP